MAIIILKCRSGSLDNRIDRALAWSAGQVNLISACLFYAKRELRPSLIHPPAARRMGKYCSGKGAFYTRLNVPRRVVARQRHESRSAALRAEYALKQLSKRQKLAWVAALAGDSCLCTVPEL